MRHDGRGAAVCGERIEGVPCVTTGCRGFEARDGYGMTRSLALVSDGKKGVTSAHMSQKKVPGRTT